MSTNILLYFFFGFGGTALPLPGASFLGGTAPFLGGTASFFPPAALPPATMPLPGTNFLSWGMINI